MMDRFVHTGMLDHNPFVLPPGLDALHQHQLPSSTVTLFSGFGADILSLCGTGLIADSKLGYITMCLDLEIIPYMSVKQDDERPSGSIQTIGMAKATWREPFVQPH